MSDSQAKQKEGGGCVGTRGQGGRKGGEKQVVSPIETKRGTSQHQQNGAD